MRVVLIFCCCVEIINLIKSDRMEAQLHNRNPSSLRSILAKSSLADTLDETTIDVDKLGDSQFNYYGDNNSTGFFIMDYFGTGDCTGAPTMETGKLYGTCVDYPEYSISFQYVVPQGKKMGLNFLFYPHVICFPR